jgi:hypothetical protein
MQEKLRCAPLPKHNNFESKKKVLTSVLENVDVKIVNKFYSTNPFTQGPQEYKTTKELQQMKKMKENVMQTHAKAIMDKPWQLSKRHQFSKMQQQWPC